jgi:hypothetical protein
MGQRNKVAVFSKQPITHERLMVEACEGAYKALQVLREISENASCEPRDRIAASYKQIETYVKLAGLVEVDSIESLPVLRAIGNAGN